MPIVHRIPPEIKKDIIEKIEREETISDKIQNTTDPMVSEPSNGKNKV